MNLQFEESTKTGALREAIRQRKEIFLETLAHDIRDDIRVAITPERSSQNIGSLKLASVIVPDILIIDGTSYSPGGTISSLLHLTSGRHTIFAAKDRKYAVHSVQVVGERASTVDLIFTSMTGSKSPRDMSSLRNSRDWFQILLATSDGHLHAKAQDVAYAHAEAMYRLKLGEWIDLNDFGVISTTERRRAESWVKNSQPLSGWR